MGFLYIKKNICNDKIFQEQLFLACLDNYCFGFVCGLFCFFFFKFVKQIYVDIEVGTLLK